MKIAMCCLLCGVVYLNSSLVTGADKPSDAGRTKLVEILEKWEAASEQIDFLDVTVRTYEYDNVFYTEKRGVGRHVWARTNRGLFSLKPAKIDADDVSSKKDPDGKLFKLLSAYPSKWYWNPESLTQISEQDKSYQSIVFPKEVDPSSNQKITPQSWLEIISGNPRFIPQIICPMVVGIQAERMLKDYHWSRLKGNKENTVSLSAVPKKKRERQEYHRIDVMLDAKTFRTLATKIIDPTGHTVRVIVFDEPKTEPSGSWEPDLTGYKKIGAQN